MLLIGLISIFTLSKEQGGKGGGIVCLSIVGVALTVALVLLIKIPKETLAKMIEEKGKIIIAGLETRAISDSKKEATKKPEKQEKIFINVAKIVKMIDEIKAKIIDLEANRTN